MDITIPDIDKVIVKKFKKNGIYLKQSSFDITLKINENNYFLKFTHERKIYSDFLYHKNFDLIQSEFIFYFKTSAGVWYNYPTIKEMFMFIGYPVDETIFNKLIITLKENSKFEENETF